MPGSRTRTREVARHNEPRINSAPRTDRRSWQRHMAALVRALKSTGAAVLVTSTANMQVARSLTPFARGLTGSHARMLNVETRRICEQSNTPMIFLDAASDLTSRTYSRWGARIGAHVSESLRDARAIPPSG